MVNLKSFSACVPCPLLLCCKTQEQVRLGMCFLLSSSEAIWKAEAPPHCISVAIWLCTSMCTRYIVNQVENNISAMELLFCGKSDGWIS